MNQAFYTKLLYCKNVKEKSEAELMHEELVKVEQFAIIEQQINDMIRLH